MAVTDDPAGRNESDSEVDRFLRKQETWLRVFDIPEARPSRLEPLFGALDSVLRREAVGRSEASASPPIEIPGYSLGHRIGAGGMGEVFVARRVDLEHEVAIKFLRAPFLRSVRAKELFEREAKRVASLRHPGIVRVHDFGHQGQVAYLVMELVPGLGLDEIIEKARQGNETLPQPKCAEWTAQIAAALEYAHSLGILHQDVKPSNLRITPEGEARLLDFGLAIDLADGNKGPSEFMGTPSYSSPEQAREERLDERTDVFSLGTTLYEALTGRLAFPGGNERDVLQRVIHSEPDGLEEATRRVSRDLRLVVKHAMEKERDSRYHSAGALREDLHAILEMRPISIRSPGAWERLRLWLRDHPVAAVVWFVFGVAAVGALSAWLGTPWWLEHTERVEANRLTREYRAAVADLVQEHEQLTRRVKSLDQLDRKQLARRPLTQRERTRLESEPEELERIRDVLSARARALQETLREIGQRDPTVDGQRLLAELEAVALARALDDWRLWSAAALRERIRLADPEGETLLAVDPPQEVSVKGASDGAVAWLFRYDLPPDGEEKLVPHALAVAGQGVKSSASPGVEPGSCVLAVVRGASPLRVGDLITEVGGHPVMEWLGASLRGEPHEIFRIVEVVSGAESWSFGSRSAFELWVAQRDDQERRYMLEARDGRELECAGAAVEEDASFEVTEVSSLVGWPATVVRGQERLEIIMPDGVEARRTTAPVWTSAEAAFELPASVHLRSGEYLLVVASEETPQLTYRVPFQVPRSRSPLPLEIRLPRRHVQDQRFVVEGLSLRFTPIVHPGSGTVFWILDHEVACALAVKVSSSEQREQLDSAFEKVYGVGWLGGYPAVNMRPEQMQDVAQALESRFEGSFALPTREQILLAARGMTSRKYPFGYWFRQDRMNSVHSRREYGPEVVQSYSDDESPYGVFDLAGSVAEAARTDQGDIVSLMGSWLRGRPDRFRIESTVELRLPNRETGFRLVWSPQ